MTNYGTELKVLWGTMEGNCPPLQVMLPLESVGVFAGKRKITSGLGKTLRFWSARKAEHKVFFKYKILQPDKFDEVAWSLVHHALWEVPPLFQIWAAK
jgi:hypothetical protein